MPSHPDARPDGVHADDLDEVGITFGPDEVTGGLFDSSSPDTTTGERTATTRGPVGTPPRRTAVLAWIAADLPEEDAQGAVPGSAAALDTLKRLLLDAPLDPLPALDSPGLATPGRRDPASRPEIWDDPSGTQPRPFTLPAPEDLDRPTEPGLEPVEPRATASRATAPAEPGVHALAAGPMLAPAPTDPFSAGLTALTALIVAVLVAVYFLVLPVFPPS
jgi:hypothetical protein